MESEATGPAAWFDRLGPALVLYARQFLDPPAAEDVVQEVFVRMIAKAAQPEDPRPWLFRSVRNRAVSEARRRRRAGRLRERVEADGGTRAWFAPSESRRLDASAAQAALERLDPGLREVVLLRVWGGLTFEQVGEILGCSAPTAHRRYAEAIETLRRELPTSEEPIRRSDL